MQFHGVMAMVLVQDIERALRFYRDTLGFTVAEEEEDWVIFHEGVGLQVSPDPIPAVNIAFTAVQVTLQVDDVQAAFAELQRQLGHTTGQLEEASYVIVREVAASDWGYGGQTQLTRRNTRLVSVPPSLAGR